MYLLKGFVTFPSFISNVVGETSLIGELSKDSLTYAVETGIYTNPSIGDVTLFSFLSEDTNEKVEVSDYYANLALNVSNTLYEASLLRTLTFDVSISRALVESAHGDSITNISFGKMVDMDNHWIPEYISFTDLVNGSLIKLWFSDPSFSIQYDETEYLFLGPVESLDALFDSVDNVRVLLDQNPMTSIMDRINAKVDKNPYTVLKLEDYKWVNGLNETETLNTIWTTVIYGRSGDNLDLIRPKLVEWILNNSTHTKNEWLALFPDIFRVSEFTIIPFWHIFAIPNRTIQSGINSPLASMADIEEVLQILHPIEGYSEVALPSTTMVTTAPIRNLTLSISANSLNRDEISILDKIVPDYISVNVNSLDFVRMDVGTQEWVHMLLGLLVAADTATKDNVTTEGYQQVIREDILYVSKVFNNITYLMAGRESIVNRFGLRGPGYLEIDPDSGCSIEEAIYNDHIERGGNIHETMPADLGLSNFDSTTNLYTLDALVSDLAEDVDPNITTNVVT